MFGACLTIEALMVASNSGSLFDWPNCWSMVLSSFPMPAPWPSANKQGLKTVAETMCNFPLHLLPQKISRWGGSRNLSSDWVLFPDFFLEAFQSWPKPWSPFGCLVERLTKHCFCYTSLDLSPYKTKQFCIQDLVIWFSLFFSFHTILRWFTFPLQLLSTTRANLS